MSDDGVSGGFLLALSLVALLSISFGVGRCTALDETKKECQRFGATTFATKIYDCKERQ